MSNNPILGLVDVPLPFNDQSSDLVELEQLRTEVPGLRAIADAARYSYGQEACLENECECEEYLDDDGNPRPGLTACPNIETRHATREDAIVRERLEYLLSEVLDLLAAEPAAAETGASVRAAVKDEIERCALYAIEAIDDEDPRGEKPRPAVYKRIQDAYLQDVKDSLAAVRQGGSDATTP